jgi:hypothetical protein
VVRALRVRPRPARRQVRPARGDKLQFRFTDERIDRDVLVAVRRHELWAAARMSSCSYLMERAWLREKSTSLGPADNGSKAGPLEPA